MSHIVIVLGTSCIFGVFSLNFDRFMGLCEEPSKLGHYLLKHIIIGTAEGC